MYSKFPPILLPCTLSQEATERPTKVKRKKKEEVGSGTGEGDMTSRVTKKGTRAWILTDLLAVQSVPLHLRPLAWKTRTQ